MNISEFRKDIVTTIRTQLPLLESYDIEENYMSLVIEQYNTLELLSRDQYDYGELSFIMDYRFKSELQILILILDKLLPELLPLSNDLKLCVTKSNMISASN